MRIEIAGAQITDEIVEVLDTLQNQSAMTHEYLETIDEITRSIILGISGDDEECPVTLSRLYNLQSIRRHILSLAEPLDLNAPANDVPLLSM